MSREGVTEPFRIQAWLSQWNPHCYWKSDAGSYKSPPTSSEEADLMHLASVWVAFDIQLLSLNHSVVVLIHRQYMPWNLIHLSTLKCLSRGLFQPQIKSKGVFSWRRNLFAYCIGKVRRSLKSLGIIIWEPWMYVQNFEHIHCVELVMFYWVKWIPWPAVGAKGKVERSPQWVRYILSAPWISVRHVMAILPMVVKTCH